MAPDLARLTVRGRADAALPPRRHRPQWFPHAVLVLASAATLLPFVWFVSVALRPRSQVYQLLPTELTLRNFVDMYGRVPQMISYYADSVIITGATVGLVVVLATLGGYAFGRLDFPLRDAIFWTIVFTIFIPPVLAVAPLYVELEGLHLLDTRQGLILMYAAWHLGLSTFVLRGVFAEIPKELEDAAQIDGAHPLAVLMHVILPLCAPGIVVAALFTFVPVWGEFVFAFTFAGDQVRPMSIGIQAFQPQASDPNYSFNAAAAAALLMFVPSALIYVLLQRWFTRGLLEGALKG